MRDESGGRTLRWQREQLGEGMPKSVPESLGLYRERLHPTGTPPGMDRWWEVKDSRCALTVATDMCVQLEAAGWPVLDRMLNPGGMPAQIREGLLGSRRRKDFEVLFARAEALLLMDRGLTDELERSLRNARKDCPPARKADTRRFDEWVRQQALTATPSR